MATKSETAFAREEAKLLADHRRVFKSHGVDYDADRRKYGQPVADHNAGFLRGWDDGYEKGYRDAKAGKASALKRPAKARKSKRR